MWNQLANLEYDRLIGSTLISLDSWRGLCVEVGLEGGYPSITKCKTVCFAPLALSECACMCTLYEKKNVDYIGGGQALSQVFVNIIDLLDSRRAGTQVRTFRSRRKLAEYTKSRDKFL